MIRKSRYRVVPSLFLTAVFVFSCVGGEVAIPEDEDIVPAEEVALEASEPGVDGIQEAEQATSYAPEEAVDGADGGPAANILDSLEVYETVPTAGEIGAIGEACSGKGGGDGGGGTECAAGTFCVGGICCNLPCAGVCESCSMMETGNPDGMCAPVMVPIQCSQAMCVGGDAVPPGMCGLGGLCTMGATIDCFAYACNNSTGMCEPTCANDTDCAVDAYCDTTTNQCFMTKPDGDPCGGNNECMNTACANGVCCNESCTATCMACSALAKGTGADGKCEPVVDGKLDLANCPLGNPASCGTTGACMDGACALYGTNTVCLAGSCAGDMVVQPTMCNGTGECNIGGGSSGSCAPYICDGGTAACTTSCIDISECAMGAYCGSNLCLPLKLDGAPASDSSQCGSGNVADGVCCNETCIGECDACTLTLNGMGDGECHSVDNLCSNSNPCAVGSCSDEGESEGDCVFTSVLDGAICPGGLCYGGSCVLDTSGSAGTTTSGATASSSSGGASSGSAGGQLVFDFDEAIPELEGGGPCTASGVRRASDTSYGWMLAGVALALGASRRRRDAGSAGRGRP